MRAYRSLSGRFLVVGGIVMIIVMLAAGMLITSIVSRDAIKGTAASTALFMQAISGEFVSELASSHPLPPSAVVELDALFAADSFRQRFPYLEIWSPEGRVIYSNSSGLIGHNFAPPPGLLRAMKGEIAAEYTDLDAEEHTIRGFKTQFLEIYCPLRTRDGRVVAVAEIHESAEPLREQLGRLTRTSWGVVAGATLLIGASLFGVVYQGSRTIERQETVLRQRVLEAERVSEQNRALRDRVRRASARLSEVNERFLRRIGADLHDGPTQLLTLAMLQASQLAELKDEDQRQKRVNTLIRTIEEGVKDLRGIAKGLLMPQVPGQSLKAVLTEAARAHEARTQTTVKVDLDALDRAMPDAVTACVFRFVQEGLANAYHHSSGVGQEVIGSLRDHSLVIAVLNDAGSRKEPSAMADRGLGLIGLRSRVESLGGTVVFGIGADQRARLEMQINIADEVLRG